MRKGLIQFLAALVIVAVILVIGVFTLANTDWGRDQVRKRIVATLQGNSHGIIKVGKITGNLLKGFTLHDLVITDSAGAPFVKADEASARYTLRSLTSKRVEFDDVRLVRAVIVLDRVRRGRWNYDRIFPRDTLTPAGRRKTGWGTWIRFTDVTLVDADVTVRSPWEPESVLDRRRAKGCESARRSDLKVVSCSSRFRTAIRRSRSSTTSTRSCRCCASRIRRSRRGAPTWLR